MVMELSHGFQVHLRIMCLSNYYYYANNNCIVKTETLEEMLRSILAQLHYAKSVIEWDGKGVPFRTHAYVPEIHPVTSSPFQEREDEAHVLKV